MAIRYRKDRSSWQVYWQNPSTGKRESKTFATKAEAEKENSLILHRLKFERDSFSSEEDPPPLQERTLEQVYLEYLCEKRFAKRALGCHRNALAEALRLFGDRDVASLTREDLQVLKERYLSLYSPQTAHDRLGRVRTVFYYAVERGYREALAFPKIPAPHYTRFIPPSWEEISQIFDAAAHHLQRAIILGAYCGARIGPSELLQLTWEDVDLARKTIRIHGAKKNPHAPWREVPIRESLLPVFETWQTEDLKEGVQYLVHFRGKPVGSLKTAWRQALKRAGITRRIRPYDLRHAFGTELVAAGVDVGTVAQLMGHSNPTMLLQHYQYILDKQKKAAIEALPDIHVPKRCAQQSPRET